MPLGAVLCTHAQPTSSRPFVYRPRKPKESAFYRLVEDNIETFLLQANDPLYADSPSVSSYAETALRDFLTCGLPGEGVAIATCEACGRTVAIPFSCKRRCPCPSCSTKFMTRTAARLVEEVVPDVPMRMLVLTLPKRLRYFLDKDKKIRDGVSRILAAETQRFFRKLTGLKKGRCGSLQFLQWGSSHDLGKHLHYHQVTTDGVFLENARGEVEFHEARPPTLDEVKEAQERIARRVLRLFVRHGCLEKEEAQQWMNWEHSGFCLDASVAVEGSDRKGLERLLRYCGRPNFVAGNVQYFPEKERVVYRLPKPHVDGRSELLLTPMEFLQRVVTLIPLPRKNCLRYIGVFGANSTLRGRVVRRCLQEQLTIFPSEEKKKIKRNRLYLTWAALIRRIFEDDPLRCPCGGEMRIVKFLTGAAECADYLQSHGLEAPTADPRPARSPPGLEDYVDPTPPDDWYGIDPPCSEE